MPNILFTCAGRRNYLINYFKKELNGGLVFAADNQNTAPALVDADNAIIMPSIHDDNYINSLKKAISQYKIDALISLNDFELPILAKNKAEIESTGVKVIVSSPEVINISFDKWETHHFIEKIGLKSPKTYISLESAITAINNGDLKFPLVVKPRWGSASVGIDFADNIEELELIHKLQLLKIEKSYDNAMSGDDSLENALLIQEKIDGTEYGMDILNDFEGKYFGSFAREKLFMRSGETDKAKTVKGDDFNKIGRQIGEKLGHIGTLDCDIFRKGKDLYVLELNPRFGGGYPFSHEGGINTAAIYVNWLMGNNNVQEFNNYQSGVIFSKCDRLLKIS
ncbi:ATP-grasp domain-containing protein [Spongiivirga citrea]|uniref:ATP-grasp domain-containing protein n=1 Tax=Spongiivirga citrea TaxID=1481457 RepID=A0A6M0CG50_9FLAO|nr:ATP-grasp domain-containing protein [Spongiivirga citrea]NER16876.1 ATP-grasp domain-containing protein [Spongiivirga citrea]